MIFLAGTEKRKRPFLRKKREEKVNDYLQVHHLKVKAKSLERKVKVDVYMPVGEETYQDLPTLLLNDGQDAEALQLKDTLTHFYHNLGIKVAVVAVRAGDRLNEYGIAGIPDYMNRGFKAQAYTEFVVDMLIPFLSEEYHLFKKVENNMIAGFSLGGLSAMDIAWHHPEVFSHVGVFSGSFWWRSKPKHGVYDDSDRIMHRVIRESIDKPELRFWLEAGTKDEESDRNNNGIIDAIDDTLDIIKELKDKGFDDADIVYEEIEGGEHNFDTWSKVFPRFLDWCVR